MPASGPPMFAGTGNICTFSGLKRPWPIWKNGSMPGGISRPGCCCCRRRCCCCCGGGGCAAVLARCRDLGRGSACCCCCSSWRSADPGAGGGSDLCQYMPLGSAAVAAGASWAAACWEGVLPSSGVPAWPCSPSAAAAGCIMPRIMDMMWLRGCARMWPKLPGAPAAAAGPACCCCCRGCARRRRLAGGSSAASEWLPLSPRPAACCVPCDACRLWAASSTPCRPRAARPACASSMSLKSEPASVSLSVASSGMEP